MENIATNYQKTVVSGAKYISTQSMGPWAGQNLKITSHWLQQELTEKIKDLNWIEVKKFMILIGKRVVGVIGFEPTTSCSQSRYATKLRYTPPKF